GPNQPTPVRQQWLCIPLTAHHGNVTVYVIELGILLRKNLKQHEAQPGATRARIGSYKNVVAINPTITHPDYRDSQSALGGAVPNLPQDAHWVRASKNLRKSVAIRAEAKRRHSAQSSGVIAGGVAGVRSLSLSQEAHLTPIDLFTFQDTRPTPKRAEVYSTFNYFQYPYAATGGYCTMTN